MSCGTESSALQKSIINKSCNIIKGYYVCGETCFYEMRMISINYISMYVLIKTTICDTYFGRLSLLPRGFFSIYLS